VSVVSGNVRDALLTRAHNGAHVQDLRQQPPPSTSKLSWSMEVLGAPSHNRKYADPEDRGAAWGRAVWLAYTVPAAHVHHDFRRRPATMGLRFSSLEHTSYVTCPHPVAISV
jgi:hypothetical protein